MTSKKKTGKPNSFTFYDGFAEAVELLPDVKTKAAFVYDFYNYGAWGIEPTFGWAKNDPAILMAVKMAWRIAVPSIDKNVKDRKNSVKPPKPGSRRRGRPRKDEVEKTIEDSPFPDIPDSVIDSLAQTMYEPMEVF